MQSTEQKSKIDGIELNEITALHESYGQFILRAVHDRAFQTIGSIHEELEAGESQRMR